MSFPMNDWRSIESFNMILMTVLQTKTLFGHTVHLYFLLRIALFILSKLQFHNFFLLVYFFLLIPRQPYSLSSKCQVEMLRVHQFKKIFIWSLSRSFPLLELLVTFASWVVFSCFRLFKDNKKWIFSVSKNAFGRCNEWIKQF